MHIAWRSHVEIPMRPSLSMECGFPSSENTLGLGGSLKLSLGFSALSPPEVVILRNHPLLLNCSGYSEEGPLQIYWKYQDVTIRDKHFQILSNGSLYIERTVSQKKRERRWDGNYTCLLKNRVGSLASRPIRVIFARMSKTFTSEPQPLTTHEGGQARFSCQIYAVPPADISWYKDGIKLPQNNSRYTFLPSGTLQITGVSLSDSGDYKCHCSNIARQRNSTEAALTVLPRIEQFQPPVFLSPGEEVTAIANKPTVLECLADGFPTVELSWKREDGEEIPDQLLRSGNLYFPKVQPNHSGSYICTAKTVNKDINQIATAIQKVPLTVHVPPKFLKVPVSQIIPTAQTVRFDCEVESVPAASIQWLKDGEQVYINGRIKLKPGNTLVISQTVTTDSGIYQCVASNGAGTTTSAARLQVNASSDQPQPPSDLKAFTMSSSAIVLSWEPVISLPSAPIQAYTVHYVPSNGGIEQDAVAVNTSLLIERLKPYSNYTFYVRAYSNKSASEPSQPIVQMTGEDVPLVAPKITLSSISPTTLHVQWEQLPMSKARGIITGHRIYYRKHKQASSTVRSSNLATEYTITGLTPKQKYDVRVLSGTKAGFPSLSDEAWPWVVHEMPPLSSSKVPLPPTVHLTVVNNTALQVEWSMPSDNPYPVNGYYLSYRQQNKPLKRRITLPANATKFLLYDLAPQTWYEVYLVAFNKKGESQEAVRKIITSSGDNPDAETVEIVESPHQLEAEPTSSTHIRLTWKAPETSRNISYYTIRYHPVFASSLVNESSISYIRSTNNEVLITDLQPYTLYEFAVRSHDVDKRQGPFSPTVECRTKEALPSTPQDLTWSPIDANSIRLNWQPPKYPNGLILAYCILYSTRNSKNLDTWSYKEEKGTETTTVLAGLASNTLYYLRMKVKNGAGFSLATEAMHINIPVRNNNNTKLPSQENFNTQSPDQYLGIIIGAFIGLGCLIICAIIIKSRNRCCPSPPVDPHVTDARYSACRGNGYIPQMNGHILRGLPGEKRTSIRESQEMECFTPMLNSYPNGSNDRHLDTKGGYGMCNGRANGIPPQILRNSHSSLSSHQGLVGNSPAPESDHPVSQNSKRYTVNDRKVAENSWMDEAGDITSSTVLLDDDDEARPADNNRSTPSKNDAPATGATTTNVAESSSNIQSKDSVPSESLSTCTVPPVSISPRSHPPPDCLSDSDPNCVPSTANSPTGERSCNRANSSNSEPLPFSVNAFLSPLTGPRFSPSSNVDAVLEPT
ncbi:protogenin A [Nephila pilipes]|uniref:Protogenin A n=1 Tax=Nephila pilipes TaxID=299642 RepID=A0A8X6UB09_NEPPI|nr:protogenin A [Nephila pilipes]